ncbi:MAG: ATP-grasp domain-containing protein [Clostridia bacterium]|nr:ATP-grasp domain-containing protein [Clostridia bacterium]
MKKLLLLGGSKFALPIIREAHKLGIYVITCDYLPDNIAHKYSDEYQNVSIIDKEAVLNKAKEMKIDGIMSFACDPGVVTAAYVAEKLGLPSAGSYESISILQNKGLFRKFLFENGFNVPNSKAYTNIDLALSETELFNWPVIVKPTDSAGSKGVKKVEKIEDLKEAIEYALKFSHCNEFIIEDFLTQKGFSSDCDSFCINGKFVSWGFNCQYFDKYASNPYTPSGYSWPASISNKNVEYLKSEIQRLITLLNMKTAIFNIEVRECNNGKAYIMECTPRGGGNRLSEMIELGSGAIIISNEIRFSVGLPLVPINPKLMKDNLVEVILHSDKPGVFSYLDISKDINGQIVEKDLWVKPGDLIGGFTGANEAIGTLVFQFDSRNDVDMFMSNIHQYIKIVLKEV